MGHSGSQDTKKFLGAVMLLVGGGALLIGISEAYHTRSFLESRVEVEAEVVRNETRREPMTSDPHRLRYHPVFRFQDGEQEDRVVVSRSYTSSRHYAPGDRVDIHYDLDDPGGAEIRSFFGLWAGSLLFGLSGGFFVVVGVVSLFLGLRAPRETPDDPLRRHPGRLP